MSTQPPTTQGKYVGGSDDETPMEEVEGLLDVLCNYESQEQTDVGEFRTPDHTLGVREKDPNTSNHLSREVSLVCGISPHEKRAATCLFSASDIVFKSDYVDGQRNVLENQQVQIFENIFSTITDVRERYGVLPEVLVCMFEDYMLHENNPNHGKMAGAEIRILTMGCRTSNNFVDCGVFVVHHMETYKGEEQLKELQDLRNKYAAKILLADFN
ncbi:hypothetical protein Tco_1154624 [Tanacetum coccineum]